MPLVIDECDGSRARVVQRLSLFYLRVLITLDSATHHFSQLLNCPDH
jgi:hypothetical protein